MDGLLVVLAIVVWVLSYANKKNKKSKVKTQTNITRGNAAQNRTDRLAQMHAESEKRRNVQPVQSKREMPQTILGEGESSYQNLSSDSSKSEYMGSLQVESTEGECICDPSLEHESEKLSVGESVYTEEIGREPLVDFSAKGIVQGIVMSEILKRPTRRIRYR